MTLETQNHIAREPDLSPSPQVLVPKSGEGLIAVVKRAGGNAAFSVGMEAQKNLSALAVDGQPLAGKGQLDLRDKVIVKLDALGEVERVILVRDQKQYSLFSPKEDSPKAEADPASLEGITLPAAGPTKVSPEKLHEFVKPEIGKHIGKETVSVFSKEQMEKGASFVDGVKKLFKELKITGNTSISKEQFEKALLGMVDLGFETGVILKKDLPPGEAADIHKIINVIESRMMHNGYLASISVTQDREGKNFAMNMPIVKLPAEAIVVSVAELNSSTSPIGPGKLPGWEAKEGIFGVATEVVSDPSHLIEMLPDAVTQNSSAGPRAFLLMPSIQRSVASGDSLKSQVESGVLNEIGNMLAHAFFPEGGDPLEVEIAGKKHKIQAFSFQEAYSDYYSMSHGEGIGVAGVGAWVTGRQANYDLMNKVVTSELAKEPFLSKLGPPPAGSLGLDMIEYLQKFEQNPQLAPVLTERVKAVIEPLLKDAKKHYSER